MSLSLPAATAGGLLLPAHSAAYVAQTSFISNLCEICGLADYVCVRVRVCLCVCLCVCVYEEVGIL